MENDYKEEPAKVFCVQQPRSNDRDLSSANRYGRLEFLMGSDAMPSINPSACLHLMNKQLLKFEHKDYMFYAGGDPLGLGLAMCLLKDNGFTEFQYLRWERERDIKGQRRVGLGFYVPVRIKLKF